MLQKLVVTQHTQVKS